MAGALMLLVAALSIYKHFARLEWVPWLCFGLFWFLFVPRQQGEPFAKYFSKPRAIASGILVTTAMAGFPRNLHAALMR